MDTQVINCPKCLSTKVVLVEVVLDQDQTKSMCACRDCNHNFLVDKKLVESSQVNAPVKRYLKG